MALVESVDSKTGERGHADGVRRHRSDQPRRRVGTSNRAHGEAEVADDLVANAVSRELRGRPDLVSHDRHGAGVVAVWSDTRNGLNLFPRRGQARYRSSILLAAGIRYGVSRR